MASRRALLRDRLVRALLGVDIDGFTRGVEESLNRIEREQVRLSADVKYLTRRATSKLDRARAERDNLDRLRSSLDEIRASAEYSEALADRNPLISVRIASYQRTEELMDVAISSVLAQSYERFEVIVVNDGPNEATRRALAGLGDPRVRYQELPERASYPSDPHARWMVAGSPGMNRGASAASGRWIAPLDEDDAFTPDHLEKLLALALEEQAELAYGALVQRNLVNQTETVIWSSPPAISQFSFQGALYLRCLHPTFAYDEKSWKVEEPGDWNLIRRMGAAGIRMAATTDVVAVMNQVPYTHKEDS